MVGLSEAIWVVPQANDMMLYILIWLMIGIPIIGLLDYRLIKWIAFLDRSKSEPDPK